MQIIHQLNDIIDEFNLLKHPFYQAWSKGELSLETLQRYAAQYYHQVKSFPRFISRIHTFCDDEDAEEVRRDLVTNLMDEDGVHGKNHPSLWRQFGQGLGLSKEKMDEPMIPETKAMVDKYYELASRDWTHGLCALYAYESQVPEVSASKIAGLKEFYGITDEATLEFFTAHQVYDVEHAKQIADLIEAHVEPEAAKIATREAAEVLSQFLDGMCRECHVVC